MNCSSGTTRVGGERGRIRMQKRITPSRLHGKYGSFEATAVRRYRCWQDESEEALWEGNPPFFCRTAELKGYPANHAEALTGDELAVKF